MAERKFSMEEAIKYGWDTAINNLAFFIKALIIVCVISISLSAIGNMTEKNLPLVSIAANLLYAIISIIFGIGLIKIYLKLFDNETLKLGDLLSGLNLNLFLLYLLVSILYALIILAGLILLIVPGIIWAIQFQFCTFLIVDKGLGPIEALKKSSAATRGVKWDLFIFGLLILLINLVGVLAFLIGLFVTIPVTMMALTSVYRKLLTRLETAQAAAAAGMP
jgi:uncharacterized membrane protein